MDFSADYDMSGNDFQDLLHEGVEENNVEGSHANVHLANGNASYNYDGSYPSEEEIAGQNGNNEEVQQESRTQPSQTSSRRIRGVWGSGFWRDRQMVENEGENNASKSIAREDSDNNVSVDGEQGDFEESGSEKSQKSASADDLMSDDDYYDDGGDAKSESLSEKEGNRANSHPPPRPNSMNRNLQRRTVKIEDEDKYQNDEDDIEGDEDDIDEDDPEDADFNPLSFGKGRKRKAVISDDEEYAEEEDPEDEDDNDDAVSSESEEEYKAPTRRVTRSKQVRKQARGHTVSSRPKRGRTASESSMEQDTDEESDGESYGARKKKVSSSRRIGTRQNVYSDNDNQGGELRLSGRSMRKVSYAESQDSEDDEEERAKKRIKVSMDDIEEEDPDTIERVLWYQPLGMAQDLLSDNKSTEPIALSISPDSDLDWNEIEFLIKWKGQSYLHCQWQPLSELQNLSGYKKVLNFMKRVEEERAYRQALSREEAEVHDVSKEMELDLLKQYKQVERVFADRTVKGDSDQEMQEYLVKWKGLSYAEATWEKDIDIAFAQEAISEYKRREELSAIQGKTVDMQRRRSKESLRKLEQQPEWLKGGTLRDYQLEGLNFLVNSWRNDTNVILADEMGLGKTVQSVSVLGFLKNVLEVQGPFLVIVPLSTITNWAKEFKKWLPDMNIIVYVGNVASREMCQRYEFYTNKPGRSIKFNALVSTYEVVLRDKATLSKIKWNYMMIDEAHRLKNSEAALYTALSEFSTKNTLLITGTPLQNSVEELWALLHFLEPEKFKYREEFVEKYKNLSSINEKELADLHKELRPHLLRRVIKDVEKSLPPKIERILRVDMSPLQKQYYKWILERNFRDLNKGVRGNQVSLLNIVVELKKCCNHPFLFESADYGYGGDSNLNDSNKVERIVLSSGKLVILDKLLVRLRETKHRVLIFSQMVRMLDILAEYLKLRGFQFQRLDGSTRADLRHQAMEHFNAPGSEDFCFLLSTRAGGLGINLATADTVIIFDSDWNPQNDLQAMSRAHRIGQREVVNIYRFVTKKSVEEDILERAKQKMVLDHLVIQKLNAQGRLEKKETKKGTSLFDKNELSAILRFGAEELFKEEKNDEEAKAKLQNMDIDEILERAEKVETKVPGEEVGSELLSAFKVANFSTTEDDGTFWSRLIQPEAICEAEDALAPRAARNSRSYAEDYHVEKSGRRKKRGSEFPERVQKRTGKAPDSHVHVLPRITGAASYVCEWACGGLSKKDANNFVKAVKKYGDPSRIKMIAAEVGGSIKAAPKRARLELFESLVRGCEEALEKSDSKPKGALLDFFGVPVKANEVAERVKHLQLLSKRIDNIPDPIKNFRLETNPRNPSWAKNSSWSQADDIRLLLGIHYYGYGNWEKIRTDTRLGLNQKIAPAGLKADETFLPRAPHLDARATTLLHMEFEPEKGITSKGLKRAKASKSKDEKPTRPSLVGFQSGRSNLSNNIRHSKINKEIVPKRRNPEPETKEEGEISESEEPHYRKYKEKLEKEDRERQWQDWCVDVMSEQRTTLNRWQKLQATSADLPKEKVLEKVKKYMTLVGNQIGEVLKNCAESHNYEKIETRLWQYVASFCNLSGGERLKKTYEQLIHDAHQDGTGNAVDTPTAGPSGRDYGSIQPVGFGYDHQNTRRYPYPEAHAPSTFNSNQETGKSEAWKRRRRPGGYQERVGQGSIDGRQFYPYPNPSYPPVSNGNRIHEPNTGGILGCAPVDNRRFPGSRWNRNQSNYSPPSHARKFSTQARPTK